MKNMISPCLSIEGNDSEILNDSNRSFLLSPSDGSKSYLKHRRAQHRNETRQGILRFVEDALEANNQVDIFEESLKNLGGPVLPLISPRRNHIARKSLDETREIGTNLERFLREKHGLPPMKDVEEESINSAKQSLSSYSDKGREKNGRRKKKGRKRRTKIGSSESTIAEEGMKSSSCRDSSKSKKKTKNSKRKKTESKALLEEGESSKTSNSGSNERDERIIDSVKETQNSIFAELTAAVSTKILRRDQRPYINSEVAAKHRSLFSELVEAVGSKILNRDSGNEQEDALRQESILQGECETQNKLKIIEERRLVEIEAWLKAAEKEGDKLMVREKPKPRNSMFGEVKGTVSSGILERINASSKAKSNEESKLEQAANIEAWLEEAIAIQRNQYSGDKNLEACILDLRARVAALNRRLGVRGVSFDLTVEENNLSILENHYDDESDSEYSFETASDQSDFSDEFFDAIVISDDEDSDYFYETDDDSYFESDKDDERTYYSDNDEFCDAIVISDDEDSDYFYETDETDDTSLELIEEIEEYFHEANESFYYNANEFEEEEILEEIEVEDSSLELIEEIDEYHHEANESFYYNAYEFEDYEILEEIEGTDNEFEDLYYEEELPRTDDIAVYPSVLLSLGYKPVRENLSEEIFYENKTSESTLYPGVLLSLGYHVAKKNASENLFYQQRVSETPVYHEEVDSSETTSVMVETLEEEEVEMSIYPEGLHSLGCVSDGEAIIDEVYYEIEEESSGHESSGHEEDDTFFEEVLDGESVDYLETSIRDVNNQDYEDEIMQTNCLEVVEESSRKEYNIDENVEMIMNEEQYGEEIESLGNSNASQVRYFSDEEGNLIIEEVIEDLKTNDEATSVDMTIDEYSSDENDSSSFDDEEDDDVDFSDDILCDYEEDLRYKFLVPKITALTKYENDVRKQKIKQINKEVKENGFCKLQEAPEIAPRTPRHIMVSILAAGALDFKLRKVPEEHKNHYQSISDAAASLGRLTKLKEYEVASESVGEAQLKQDNWKPAGEAIVLTRSAAVRISNAAATMGKMARLNEEYFTNWDEDKFDQEEKVEEFSDTIAKFEKNMDKYERRGDIDEQRDERGRIVFRTSLLIHHHVRDFKDERESKNWTLETLEALEEQNEMQDNTILPTNRLPTFQMYKASEAKKDLTRQEIQDAISQGVAERAWERKYRLERPKVKLRVTTQCHCTYCKNPNPFQTHAYKKMANKENTKKPASQLDLNLATEAALKTSSLLNKKTRHTYARLDMAGLISHGTDPTEEEYLDDEMDSSFY